MTLRARLRGLQFEIISSLFVVMLAGLGIVALVMGSLAAQTVDRSAVEEMRMGARYLDRALAARSLRLADVAAAARTLSPRSFGGSWAVLDPDGRELGLGPRSRRPREDLLPLVELSVRVGEVVRGGGLPVRDLILVAPIRTSSGESGFLVGRVTREELERRLMPVLRSGAWILAMAASVFVVFGSYLLRGRIVRPVQALSEATRRVAQGDLEVRTEVRGSDELTELSRNFNQMTSSLAEERSALMRAQEWLSRSDRLATVGQLAAGVAHEVGNPVAAILGYAEAALRDDTASERSRSAVERIRAEALRIRVLVRELLDLARSSDFVLAPHAPADVLRRVAERMRPQKILEDISLDTSPDADMPDVCTDLRRVEQILINLIENAAQALVGDEDARIELRTAAAHADVRRSRRRDDPVDPDFLALREPDAVAFSVTDNGPGIPPEDLPHIFNPFFTTKDPGEGTGLGLWNSHRLAELLGGRLEVESAPGRTRFSLVLPRADRKGSDVRASSPDHR